MLEIGQPVSNPHGNENEPIMKAYKEWEEDQKKNKRPSIREVM